jgi:glycosyltransferase involved in cell wall biosynthesis
MGIAEAAIRAGHHVTHFSCTFRHSTKVQRFESSEEQKVNHHYDLVFVHAKPYKRNISFARLRSHAGFTRNLKEMIDAREKPDAVLVALPPLSQAAFLVRWGKKHNIPVVVDVIDPWPDVFSRLLPARLKPLSKVFLKPMYDQLAVILANCAGLIAISNEYVQWAKKYEPRLARTGVFLPSVPLKEVREKIAESLLVRPRQDQQLTLIYAGSLGVAYDIPVILQAAAMLESELPGKTMFVIAGAGRYQTMVEAYMKKHSNVRYLGRVGYDELLDNYSKSDLGLAQYSVGATQSVTYKLFDYLSAGLPVLNSLMSEMATLIDGHQTGFNNSPGDAPALVANIRRYLDEPGLLDRHKENALAFAGEEGDNEIVYARVVDFLDSMMVSPSPGIISKSL